MEYEQLLRFGGHTVTLLHPLVVAFLANRVFGLTRIPDVLVLMMLGVLLGPVMGLVRAGTLARTTSLPSPSTTATSLLYASTCRSS